MLFFTGLSGSGKSTVAQAVIDSLLEHGERTVTSLDGDVVRRNLSAGLTFSREDRETNIRRIGWVAAEISRHGGVAVCSPIAPFDATRQDVRAMTEAAGGAFFLVHVATPLEECERRDRKGLYAKARRGEIPDFTGISSPYDVPEDADLRLDTTGRSIDDCRDEVLAALTSSGYITGRDTETDDEPIRVLFVCTANICRSPYLELRARQLLGPDSGVEVSSAGTYGFDAAPVTDTMEAEFARWGTEVDGFRSRRRHRRPGRRCRRRSHRRGGPSHPAARGPAGGLPQDLHAGAVRGERAGRRPRPARAGAARGTLEPTGSGLARPRHRRPLPAWTRGGASRGGHHGGMLEVVVERLRQDGSAP